MPPRPSRTDARVDLVLAAVCAGVSLACMVLPSAMRDNAASALRTTVVAPLASLQARSEQARRVFLTRDALVRVADSVTLRSQRLTGVESENERLRRLLGLGAALKWGFVPAEVLQGRGLGDDFTVTLSAGRDAGVEMLSPVVAPEGLVGMVERVDKSFSLAILWPHPEFRVSAMAADESAYGIVSSHTSTGAGRYLLELRSVPLRTPLKAGAVIVSSGLGGVFPRGIPVGTVVSEMRTPEGITRSYLLRPMVKLSDIASVMVLRSERVKEGVGAVWQLGVPADSATKGVIAAADSLAKAAARPDTGRRP
ncbi:MAG: rod shape-determining protein MreC [Gemmatimonadetes bacterium]|nr:rod shape-determining protein MreC [Gemmatimonadota bacterium]MBI3567134.1 rod shape-determining protein MreC [Gemmatimonadota bacterium]